MAASDYLNNSINREATICQCANGPVPPLHSKTATRKNIEATSANTSRLKSKKNNFGSSPIANNTSVCSSHCSSELLQSLSSSITASYTSEGTYTSEDKVR